MIGTALMVAALVLQLYVPVFRPERFQRGRATRATRLLLARAALRRQSLALALAARYVRITQLLALLAVVVILLPSGLTLPDGWSWAIIAALYLDDLLSDVRRPRRPRLPLKNRVRWRWLPDPVPAPG